MRKIGIYYAYWATEWDVNFLPFVSKVKKLGFDQLEINGGTLVNMSTEERKRLKDEAEKHQIKLSYGIGLTPVNDVSSTNENIRHAGIGFMKNMISAVNEMNGEMIGGTVHSCWPSTLPKGATDKSIYLQQSIKSMKELVKVAEDKQVILNVEVINRFEQFLLNTCEEAVNYVEEIDNPYCGILLDTFHMNIEEDSIGDAIIKAGTHLKSMHIGETNRKPPGLGRMPWGEIKIALDKIGYNGSLVMEPFVNPGGKVGRDIGVWRELMPGADLDFEAAKAVEFVRENLL
ncbi:MAG: sugar phosphate isomerase/epimerase [Bacteroidetes bacterium]|nr:sugar phosphate isomerase/epimerase [Bacteroidota bacterium]